MSFDQQYLSCLTAGGAQKNKLCDIMETNLPRRCQGPMTRKDSNFCEVSAFLKLKDPSGVCQTLQSKRKFEKDIPCSKPGGWTAQTCAFLIEKDRKIEN
jgi:hypothetical protein